MRFAAIVFLRSAAVLLPYAAVVAAALLAGQTRAGGLATAARAFAPLRHMCALFFERWADILSRKAKRVPKLRRHPALAELVLAEQAVAYKLLPISSAGLFLIYSAGATPLWALLGLAPWAYSPIHRFNAYLDDTLRENGRSASLRAIGRRFLEEMRRIAINLAMFPAYIFGQISRDLPLPAMLAGLSLVCFRHGPGLLSHIAAALWVYWCLAPPVILRRCEMGKMRI